MDDITSEELRKIYEKLELMGKLPTEADINALIEALNESGNDD